MLIPGMPLSWCEWTLPSALERALQPGRPRPLLELSAAGPSGTNTPQWDVDMLLLWELESNPFWLALQTTLSKVYATPRDCRLEEGVSGASRAIPTFLRECSVLHLTGLDPAFIPPRCGAGGGGGTVKLCLIDGEQLLTAPSDRK